MRKVKTTPLEAVIHKQIVNYLKAAFPEVIFRTDYAAGMKLSIGQAVQHKRMQQGRAFPDLFIAEPRGVYHGLFLEIKRDQKSVFKKNGELIKNKRILEQAETLADLNRKGYCALFAVGFVEARKIIDAYMLSSDVERFIS